MSELLWTRRHITHNYLGFIDRKEQRDFVVRTSTPPVNPLGYANPYRYGGICLSYLPTGKGVEIELIVSPIEDTKTPGYREKIAAVPLIIPAV